MKVSFQGGFLLILNEVNMQTFTASEARSKLGLVLDMSQRGPVSIEKQGRLFAVIISQEEYERLEDAYWILKAKKGKKSGLLSTKASKIALEKLRKSRLP